ncbi:MAG: hypothetical protein K0Q43_1853 [Ramlibacter sp.]|jgi:hypothetical protein|nr:hypothetical protein [Ramlibacter sp.]
MNAPFNDFAYFNPVDNYGAIRCLFVKQWGQFG